MFNFYIIIIQLKNIFIVAVLFSSAINVLIYIHILTFYFIL